MKLPNSLLTLIICTAAFLVSGNSDVLAKMREFRTTFQDLCKVRNDLLHASWLIGSDVVEVTDKESPNEILAEKRTPNKEGARVQILAQEIADVRTHSIEAKRVKEMSIALTSTVIITIGKAVFHEHPT